MRALDINLSSQPFRNNTLLWIGYGLGFALALGVLAWNVETWWVHRQKLGEMGRTIEDIEERMADLSRREVAARQTLSRDEYNLAALTVQAVAANEVIDWKAFSWTRLFNRMEEVLPWNVQLTSVRPLFRGRRGEQQPQGVDSERKSIVIAVEGYAKTLEALLDFEVGLFKDRDFDYPEPRRHQPTEQGEIVFELDFTYYPEAVAGEAGEDAPPVEAAPGEEAAPEGAGEAEQVAETDAPRIVLPSPGGDPAAGEAQPQAQPEPQEAVGNPLAATDPAATIQDTPAVTPPAGRSGARQPAAPRPGATRPGAPGGARNPAAKSGNPLQPTAPKRPYANVASPRQEGPRDLRREREEIPPPPYATEPPPEEQEEQPPDQPPDEQPPPEEEKPPAASDGAKP